MCGGAPAYDTPEMVKAISLYLKSWDKELRGQLSLNDVAKLYARVDASLLVDWQTDVAKIAKQAGIMQGIFPPKIYEN